MAKFEEVNWRVDADNPSTRDIAMRQALRTAERAQQRIEFLMSLPDEPVTTDPDGALVLWFERRFGGRGKVYTYAVVKAGDGLWYTTGPQSPKGYTWDQFVTWLMEDETVVLWQATEFEPIS